MVANSNKPVKKAVSKKTTTKKTATKVTAEIASKKETTKNKNKVNSALNDLNLTKLVTDQPTDQDEPISTELTIPKTIKNIMQLPYEEQRELYYKTCNGQVVVLGRRKKQTFEEIEEKIQEYLENCTTKKLIATKTGLILALGYSDRRVLDRMVKRGDLCYNELMSGKCDKDKTLNNLACIIIATLVKRANLYSEELLQQALMTNGKSVGAIFALKNHFNYVDKREIDSNVNSKAVVINVHYGKSDDNS